MLACTNACNAQHEVASALWSMCIPDSTSYSCAFRSCPVSSCCLQTGDTTPLVDMRFWMKGRKHTRPTVFLVQIEAEGTSRAVAPKKIIKDYNNCMRAVARCAHLHTYWQWFFHKIVAVVALSSFMQYLQS